MKLKKLTALILAAMCAMSLAACAGTPAQKEEGSNMDIYVPYTGELSVAAAKENVFGVTDAESDAIWAWAQECYEDWLPRYQTLLERKKTEQMPALLKEDSTEWNRTIYSNTQWTWDKYKEDNSNKHMTRTLSSLKNWEASPYNTTDVKTDRYGGLMDESMKQEATGSYYVRKIGDRWWLIDPLGYPTYMRGIIGAIPSYNGQKTQLDAAIKKYGSAEKWSIAKRFELGEQFGFSSTTGWSEDTLITDLPEPLASYKTFYFIVYYGTERGIARKSGSSVFDQADNVAKNTMPVFDPEFVPYVEAHVKEYTDSIAGNPDIMYYHTDNEIPMNTDMLMRSLTLDPAAEVNGVKVNAYTYACAWTWFWNMTGKANATTEDITTELSEIFRGFVYDRYYAVVAPVCRKYDGGEHLYAGVRFLTGPATTCVVYAEWVIRFASLWTDIISINWYKQWTPTAQDLANLTVWSGDKPFLISEYGARSEEAGTIAGTHAAGAAGGWYTRNDSEQAAFFENFTLRMIEWKNNIGYQWYRYSNYWIGETLQSGGGIVTDEHEWRQIAYSMKEINTKIYGLIDFLDERQK